LFEHTAHHLYLLAHSCLYQNPILNEQQQLKHCLAWPAGCIHPLMQDAQLFEISLKIA
jgi:hypothetical protein